MVVAALQEPDLRRPSSRGQEGRSALGRWWQVWVEQPLLGVHKGGSAWVSPGAPALCVAAFRAQTPMVPSNLSLPPAEQCASAVQNCSSLGWVLSQLH